LLAALLLLSSCAGPGGPGTSGSTASPSAPAATPSPAATGSAPGTAGPPAPSGSGGGTAVAPVFLIVFENKDYEQVMDAAAAPYLMELAHQYAYATNDHAVAHPSQPNYLALFSGSTYGVTDDGTHDLTGTTIADQLEAAGRSWRVFAENAPPGCYTGARADGGADGPGLYTRKHNPAISFGSIRNDPARCADITDFSHFDPNATDFSLIVPNACHDMHDCSVSQGDSWLRSFLPKILHSQAFAGGGTVFITFDEEHQKGNSNLVPLIVVGKQVRAGTTSDQPYTHYSLLRTMQQMLGIGCLANSCSAQPIEDLFR
jgi:acid phosphatase